MTTDSSVAKLVQEVIKKLKTVADVTKFVGSGNNARIYPSHLSTQQDVKYPAISLHIFPSPGAAVTEAGMETIDFQVDFWFSQLGDNGNTIDDVMECHAAALKELHNNTEFDSSITANIFQIRNINQGPYQIEQDRRLMHYSARYRAKVIVE